ncbi:MAG: DUF4041 domain-containing protein [Bacteriovoracaceae bacterium]|nr:DUF4041 domain-containing protein [Bacteriovoracaceae bacterium]
MSILAIFILIFLSSALIVIAFKWLQLKKKYSPLIDMESELNKLNKSKLNIEDEIKHSNIRFEQIQNDIKSLEKEHALLFDDIDVAQAGLIKLKYDFKTSKEYEVKLDDIREKQKLLIKAGRALVCSIEWTVGNSKAEGKKMINRLIKLGLNSFNAQCDNIILNVKYTNFDRSKEKLIKLEESIEKLLEVNRCKITSDFFNLKMEELELVFEYQEKLYEEKEEQKRIRIQMQEEEKVRKEIERAKLEAEKEELYYEKALDKAKKDLEKKKDSEKESYMLKIQELEQQLKDAHEKKERAQSMAEQTKRGHVYIISNIGSFGEKVFKIGMTRRLDPMDRVDELGDASVPFDFDVHAMIFSEDAPDLEKQLHNLFTEKRTNQINLRKEFFNVTIDEIESACKGITKNLKLTKRAEAKDYYQTLEKIKTLTKKTAA